MDCERMPLSNTSVSTQTSKREPHFAVRAATLGATEPAFRGRVHKITRTVRRILSDPADVEDIVQQTFVNALVHINSFRAEAALDTWLTRIAINEALMRWRKRRSAKHVSIEQPSDGNARATLPELADPRPNPEENFRQKEVSTLINDSLESLSSDYRAVLVMHYFNDLSYEQIASCLGLTVSATKSRLLRARRQMARVLKDRFCGGHTKRQNLILPRCLAADRRHSIRHLHKSISKYET